MPVVNWFRNLGFTVNLHTHWRQVFILLWLFNSSYSGAFAPVQSDLLDKNWKESRGQFVFIGLVWLSAVLIALVAGVSAGLVPIDDSAVFWRPIIAFFFVSARAALAATFQDRSHARPALISLAVAVALLTMELVSIEDTASQGSQVWWAIAAYFLYSAALVIKPRSLATSAGARTILLLTLIAIGANVAIATGIIPLPEWFNTEQSPSPGLSNLALFVAALGFVDLFSAAYWNMRGEGTFMNRWLNSPKATSALRILYVIAISMLAVFIWGK